MTAAPPLHRDPKMQLSPVKARGLTVMAAAALASAPAAAQVRATQAAAAPRPASGYLIPPPPIPQIIDTPPTPAVSVSPTRRTLALLARENLPSLAELAEPWLPLAGYRINPKTNGWGAARVTYLNAIAFQDLSGRAK